MKIFAVGMNYREHNKELAHTLYNKEVEGLSAESTQLDEDLSDLTAKPVIFTKCDTALLRPGAPFFLPAYTKQCEYETELVVRIGHMGRCIPERWVHRYIDAVTVGIDFTARDLQRQLTQKGLPWDICKGFDGSAAVGEWVPIDEVEDLQNIHFHLDINGNTVQQGHSADMIHSVKRLVSYISQFFMLKTGDLIYTGTPAGVGPVHIDDHLVGYFEDKKVMEFNVK